MRCLSTAVFFGSLFIPSVVVLRKRDMGRVHVGTKTASLTTQDPTDNGIDGRASAGEEFSAYFDSTLFPGSKGGGAWALSVVGVIGHGFASSRGHITEPMSTFC